ncbi:MAG: gas vesicle protein K [Desulfobaccales bacterium]
MKPAPPVLVESPALSDFSKIMQGDGLFPDQAPGGQVPRINLDQDNIKNSLGQLVLTLVKLLHELLERQGIRRIEAGSLTDAQIERLGLTLMKQSQEIDRLRREFGLEEADLNIDLGPLGQLL